MKNKRNIAYIQYTNPALFPPLEHSSRILARNGWKVTFLGIGALGDADRLRFPEDPKIIVRQLPYCRPGWRQKFHYLYFCLWCLWHVLCDRPSCVYISDPTACPAGLILRYLPGIRVIYHEHDSP